MNPKQVTTPLSPNAIRDLRAGDQAEITGWVFTARDAAHKRMIDALQAGEQFPFDLEGQVIYYVGPAPARPGASIGSAGPTTSGRMDRYTPKLLEHGLKGMIGKGYRGQEVRDAIAQHGAVYFAAVGGSGAFLARRVLESEIVAYEDLGPEAIYRLRVERFPVIVVNDCYGDDLYERAPEQFRSSDDRGHGIRW